MGVHNFKLNNLNNKLNIKNKINLVLYYLN